MEISPQDPAFKESVTQVMQTLPPFIRTYIEQQKYTAVAVGLMTKYKLRIDQGGVLELNLLLLLMGINNPSEFTRALIEKAKLDQQTVNSIVQDVNDQIFVPLRKEEEKGGATATEVRPSPEIPKVEPQRPVPVPTSPSSTSQPASYFKLENKIPLSRPVPQPQKNVPPPTVSKGALPPKVFLPRPSPLGEVVRSILAVPKPLDDSTLLEDHEEPHIEINKISVPPPPNLPGAMPPVEAPHLEEIKPVIPVSEAVIPEVQPSPILKVEPQIQPIIPIPAEVTPELPKVEPRIQPAAPAAPVAPKPIVVAPITSYSSDPYREPVDEPPTE